jgi:hypothetical protein
MKVLASRGCDVGSKNKDKTSEEADLARENSCQKAFVGGSEEALARKKGREGREEREELPSSHGGLTRRLVREGRLFS